MSDLLTSSSPIPRLLAPRLSDAVEDTPAVLIHGPRQSGKTTLARMVGEPLGYTYISFDDNATREAAIHDPVGFTADSPGRTILDEVQRAAVFITAFKVKIDRERTPARFLLTGSANVLLVPALSDSLAGRMEILRLRLFAQCELSHRKASFLNALFQGRFGVRVLERLGRDLAERIVPGGCPAALEGKTPFRSATSGIGTAMKWTS